mmetsp:Transcript_5752/g.7893  ORF Transcript_5752/g.7893 Transcript_5752/m.7893 type:complete len:124 (-) Transcript_5752:551-922(-)
MNLIAWRFNSNILRRWIFGSYLQLLSPACQKFVVHKETNINIQYVKFSKPEYLLFVQSSTNNVTILNTKTKRSNISILCFIAIVSGINNPVSLSWSHGIKKSNVTENSFRKNVFERSKSKYSN